MTQEPIVYQTGTYVKLINKAEYCKSIIADGKELIVTGNESGELIVPELKDPKVYITFQRRYYGFLGCILRLYQVNECSCQSLCKPSQCH
ncbi:hypothetical protein NXU86_09810 [Phocaeicola vulgatus]|nr:hypothetical protein [Phocaeicola vulgatus]